MTNNNSYVGPRMPTFSRNDLIKNLISLLAFKYQILGDAARANPWYEIEKN